MKTLKIPGVDGPRPGRGGARKGAGRPRGATIANGAKVPAPTQEKAALLALWKAEVGRQFPDLVAAQIASARGITHMMARDDNGKWQSVTDPDDACLSARDITDWTPCGHPDIHTRH